MAVAYDAVSESDTGTSGHASVASFSWTHVTVAAVKGVLVFVFNNANADDVTSVTYGGSALTKVPGARAVDTQTEAGDCQAWFLGSSVPTVALTVVVNRNNNANVMYGACITVTAGADTQVPNTAVLLQENQAPAEVNVWDGDSGVDSQRFAGCNYGGLGIPAAGASSTALISIDYGARTCAVVRETTAGQGRRPVGFSDGSDDVAAVHLAIREVYADKVHLDLADHFQFQPTMAT